MTYDSVKLISEFWNFIFISLPTSVDASTVSSNESFSNPESKSKSNPTNTGSVVSAV